LCFVCAHGDACDGNDDSNGESNEDDSDVKLRWDDDDKDNFEGLDEIDETETASETVWNNRWPAKAGCLGRPRNSDGIGVGDDDGDNDGDSMVSCQCPLRRVERPQGRSWP